MKNCLNHPNVLKLIELALQEDLGIGISASPHGDLTTQYLLDKDREVQAAIVARQNLVLAGIDLIDLVFEKIEPKIKINHLLEDSRETTDKTEIARLQGPAWAILAGERTVLNFLQHLCGIATKTRQFVQAIKETKTILLDTRKTTPGWRILEKYAVRQGGGHNHRFGLYDGLMIKSNHLHCFGSIEECVAKIKAKTPPTLRIEVEVRSIEEVIQALKAKADIIMLDNMDLASIRQAVKLIEKKALIEVSGRMDLNSIKSIADLGVDFISVGSLTHSAPAADISLKIIHFIIES